MSEWARQLAEAFEQANSDTISLVEGCTDEQWQISCSDEGRPSGVVLHHVAGAHRSISIWIKMIATGSPVAPLSAEMIDQWNERHLERHATCTRAETEQLLQRNGEAAASLVGALNDAQLARSATLFAWLPPMSVADLIEQRLIGHIRDHVASVRQAISQASQGAEASP
jgi:hypothetical protein